MRGEGSLRLRNEVYQRSFPSKGVVRRPLPSRLFVLLFLLILLGGLFFFARSFSSNNLTANVLEVNQYLLKVLLKDNTTLSQTLRVSNPTVESVTVYVTSTLGLLIVPSEETFTLSPGEMKEVRLTFNGSAANEGISTGFLLLSTDKGSLSLPIIVEQESEEPIVDVNTNMAYTTLVPGSDLFVTIRAFLLGSEKTTTVTMEYFVKDFGGKTIYQETETVAVDGQVSFSKSVPIPKTLAPGTYVFGVLAQTPSSLGTSSSVFTIRQEEKNTTLLGLCSSGDYFCVLSLGILSLLILFFGAYVYFFIGSYLYDIFRYPSQDQRQKRMFSTKRLFYFLLVLCSLIFLGLFFYFLRNVSFSELWKTVFTGTLSLVVVAILAFVLLLLLFSFVLKRWKMRRRVSTFSMPKIKPPHISLPPPPSIKFPSVSISRLPKINFSNIFQPLKKASFAIYSLWRSSIKLLSLKRKKRPTEIKPVRPLPHFSFIEKEKEKLQQLHHHKGLLPKIKLPRVSLPKLPSIDSSRLLRRPKRIRNTFLNVWKSLRLIRLPSLRTKRTLGKGGLKKRALPIIHFTGKEEKSLQKVPHYNPKKPLPLLSPPLDAVKKEKEHLSKQRPFHADRVPREKIPWLKKEQDPWEQAHFIVGKCLRALKLKKVDFVEIYIEELRPIAQKLPFEKQQQLQQRIVTLENHLAMLRMKLLREGLQGRKR